jgi:hypothetical protein
MGRLFLNQRPGRAIKNVNQTANLFPASPAVSIDVIFAVQDRFLLCTAKLTPCKQILARCLPTGKM